MLQLITTVRVTPTSPLYCKLTTLGNTFVSNKTKNTKNRKTQKKKKLIKLSLCSASLLESSTLTLKRTHELKTLYLD